MGLQEGAKKNTKKNCAKSRETAKKYKKMQQKNAEKNTKIPATVLKIAAFRDFGLEFPRTAGRPHFCVFLHFVCDCLVRCCLLAFFLHRP